MSREAVAGKGREREALAEEAGLVRRREARQYIIIKG